MPYITLCTLDVICSKYMFSENARRQHRLTWALHISTRVWREGWARKEIALSSPHPLPSCQELERLQAKSPEIVFVFRFQYCVFIQCLTEWLVSQFFAVCVLSVVNCNRCLLCIIVPLCLPKIMFSSSYFNGCVAKRPRRCRLPIRERSFKVTIDLFTDTAAILN